MSLDSRLRNELHQAVDAHDLGEDDALQHVKSQLPADWSDLTVVALEPRDAPRARHARNLRIVAALAACALLAGAIALPVALRSEPRAAAPPTTDPAVTTGYKSTVVIRVAPAPSATPTTQPGNIALTDPVQLATAPATRSAALARSHLRFDPAKIAFDAKTNAAGDLLSLTVIAPTRATTQALARNWASAFTAARLAEAKRNIRVQQAPITHRVSELHAQLRHVDEQLVAMAPAVYKNLLRYDGGSSRYPGDGGPNTPPDVPEHGSAALLNLAYERVQIVSALDDLAKRSATLRIATVRPEIYSQLISQTPPVSIDPPHHGVDTSTVLLAVGLLLVGVLLAGSAFWLGHRGRRAQPS